ncbi:hypothetical protein DFH09DRAFT_1173999, partial [Mycena vulgaris]
MVNILHNITALVGAATICKILDFQSHLINLSGSSPVPNGDAIISFPEDPGAPNENWLLVPQAATGTFILQSVLSPSVFVSYSTFGQGSSGSVVIASNTSPTVFRMQTVGNGPAVNLLEVSTNFTLTAWNNPDPTTRTNPATPLTMEVLNTPRSVIQSFTVQIV